MRIWKVVSLLIVVLLSANVAVRAEDGTFAENLGVAIRGIACTPQGVPFWGFDSQDVGKINLPQGTVIKIELDPVQTDLMKSVELYLSWNGVIPRTRKGEPAVFDSSQSYVTRLGSNSIVVNGVYRGANRVSVPFLTIPIVNIGVGHNVEGSPQNVANRFPVMVAGYSGPASPEAMACFTRDVLRSGGASLVDLTVPQEAYVSQSDGEGSAAAGRGPSLAEKVNESLGQGNTNAQAIEDLASRVSAVEARPTVTASSSTERRWKTAAVQFLECMPDGSRRLACYFNGFFKVLSGDERVTGRVENGQGTMTWWKPGAKVQVEYWAGSFHNSTAAFELEDDGIIEVPLNLRSELPRMNASEQEMRKALDRPSVAGLLAELRVNPVAFRQAISSGLRSGTVDPKRCYWLAWGQPAVRDLWMPNVASPAWWVQVGSVQVFCQLIAGDQNLVMGVETTPPILLTPVWEDGTVNKIDQVPGTPGPKVELPRVEKYTISEEFRLAPRPTAAQMIMPSLIRPMELSGQASLTARSMDLTPLLYWLGRPSIDLSQSQSQWQTLVCDCGAKPGEDHSSTCSKTGRPPADPLPGTIRGFPEQPATGRERGQTGTGGANAPAAPQVDRVEGTVNRPPS